MYAFIHGIATSIQTPLPLSATFVPFTTKYAHKISEYQNPQEHAPTQYTHYFMVRMGMKSHSTGLVDMMTMVVQP